MLFPLNRYVLASLIILFALTLRAQVHIGAWMSDPPVKPDLNIFCKGQCIQYKDSSFRTSWGKNDTIYKWIWTFTGTSIDTFETTKQENPPLLCYDSIGEFTFTYCWSRMNGGVKAGGICDHRTRIIKIIDAPLITVPDTQHIKVRFGDEITLKACAADNNYKWDPPDEGSCSGCPEYSIKPFSSKIYTCTVNNSNGCGKTCVYKVEVEDNPEAIYVPNAFTPNDDGLNDVFIPVELNTKIISMRIFSRWGENICEKYGSGSSWDGTFKGEKVPDGIYIYSIVYTGTSDRSQKTKTGIVTVVK